LRGRPLRLDRCEPGRFGDFDEADHVGLEQRAMISRHKLDSLRATSQSQPGGNHRRHIANITTDVADGDNARRTAAAMAGQVLAR